MKKTQERKPGTDVWVGIDWGDTAHAVSVVSAPGEMLEQFGVPNTPAGYRQLDARLAQYGTVRGVAVEATRHALLLHLQEQGVTVYLINPKQSKAWRATDTVSGAKSDQRDGLTLARGLAFRHARLQPVVPGDPALERLALLCEKECHLIQQRTALVQELESLLKVYYPAALAFFKDWTSPAAWDFLKRFPNAATLARAQASTVIAFLKGHRLGYSAHWKEKVETRSAALDWPTHPHEAVYRMQVQALVGQLHVLTATLREFQTAIEAAFPTVPGAAVVNSLPGAGPKLAPRLAAIAGSPEAQQGGPLALRGHTGVAPVTVQSGKHTVVHIRRMCNNHWRNTVHLFSQCSIQRSAWAKAFYQYHRASGDTQSTALRKLGDKWFKILRRMLQTGEPYDEARYVRALQRTNSPTWHFMNQSPQRKTGGKPRGKLA